MACGTNNDAEFVENVMMSQSILKVIEEDIGPVHETVTKKRAYSGDSCDETQCEVTKKPKQTNESSELMDLMKAQFTSFRSDLQDMRLNLTSVIDDRFVSFEKKISDAVLKVVHEEIDNVKAEFNTRIDGLSNKLEQKLTKFVESHVQQKVNSVKENLKQEMGISKLQEDLCSVKKSYACAASASTNSSGVVVGSSGIELNVVIKNMDCDPTEKNDKTVTMNKVNKLLRDGLKLKNIKVTQCERKSSRGQKPGIIVATMENAEQKHEVMRKKSHLKNTSNYKKVYIENDRSLESRVNESNMFTVLKELGKANNYFVSSNGRILKKTENSGKHQ